MEREEKGCGMFLSYFLYSTSRQFQIQRISQSLNSINPQNPCENRSVCVKKHRDRKERKGKSYTKLNCAQRWDTSSFRGNSGSCYFCRAQNVNVQVAFNIFWEWGKESSRREEWAVAAEGRNQQQGGTQTTSAKEEVCSFACRRSTPWGQPQPWVMSKSHSMRGHTSIPCTALLPQRQADEKAEVWVTWVCSFARAVLGPLVPAPTLLVPNSATPNYQSGSCALRLPLVEPLFYHYSPNHLLCIWCNFSINIPWGFVAFHVCCSPSHSHTQHPWAV